MLVVIAIIAILAAMLLPALNQARSSAYSATCSGNLKQTSMALLLYSGDYDGYILQSDKPATGGSFWMNGLYLATQHQYIHFPLQGTGGASRRSKITTCPTAQVADVEASNDRVYGMIQAMYYLNSNRWKTLGREAEFGACLVRGGTAESGYFAVHRMKNPGSLLFLSDSMRGSGNSAPREETANIYFHKDYFTSNGVNGAAIGLRHNGRANIVFFDGHVAKLSSRELFQTRMKVEGVYNEAGGLEKP